MTTEEFKILNARDHCRLRPGMYVGSTSKEIIEQFLFGEWKPVSYIPAINKMISEILDNSLDEFIRTNGKFANKIDVTIHGNSITVTDNGRGIPQEYVETPEGDKIQRPVAAWTRNNAGTSFGSTRITVGAHGLGAALVNYMSESFTGKTWSDGSLLEVVCSNGAETIQVNMKKKSGSGTEVTFTPDFSLFEVSSLQELDTIALIEDRLVSLQLAFPEIRFSFNGQKIQITDMKKYAALFTAEDASVVLEKTDNLSFFFAASDDGFRTNSFVNGVNTRQGGAYVDHIVNGVVDELIKMIKKKHKIEVIKSTLKNGLTFVLFARNFVNPKFDSQTKERLTNPVSDVKAHFEQSGSKDVKYLAKKIFAADDIIEPIIAAQLAKKEQQDRREALQGQKKLKKVKVAKHIAANKPDALLSLVEGDCIEENTLVETLEGPKKIKEITTKDLVLTHKNRFKRVESKSFSLKEGIRLNGNIYSKNHRLFVYDTEKNEFDVVEVQNISKGKHKLVRNRIVHNGIENSIHIVKNIKSGGVLITDSVKMIFSDDHEILFLTKGLEIITKKYKDISVGDVIFL